ncbi:Glycosyl transferases group 1 [Rhodoferax sp. OV413]|uniref:rhamnan synthesis F family protein n=1 Tax=Rhodoferax sp. OV413 TaxID=1855285 RepID=UPI000891E6E0|nr:rhamnan synthesis F family protein [Rhodoferax sp. OV413]SDP44845.1 Glycosyl transferases group 1 [Rhodoferax sp. OV413]
MQVVEQRKGLISVLESNVHAGVKRGEFGKALEAVRTFAEDIIFDPASVAKVFVSSELDFLCKHIGETKARGLLTQPVQGGVGTLILASEISKAGGHNELIKDIVRLHLFENPVSLLLTDCFSRVDSKLCEDFSLENGLPVEVLSGRDEEEKFSNILQLIYSRPIKNLVLLTHNQDALGVAAAFAAKTSGWAQEVVFVHHGDHHLSLGAATTEFIHVDPHQMGYFHCKNELGHALNHYWPLTVNLKAIQPRNIPFLSQGRLVTCSSGRPEKFEQGAYLYDYWTLIPQLLARSQGVHVHIGELHAGQHEKLLASLADQGIPADRFIHVPWVDSIANALVAQRVDLYISSFPLGGGKATLEAMASGTPLLMHESYRSRFHGGVDIAYTGALVWRDEAEFLSAIEGLDTDVLRLHSAMAKSHYEKFHDEHILVRCCDFSRPVDAQLIPPLRVYRENVFQRFLDELRTKELGLQSKLRLIDAQREELVKYEVQSQTLSAQWEQAERGARALELDLGIQRSQVAHLEKQAAAMADSMLAAEAKAQSDGERIYGLTSEVSALRSSTSWRITKPIRMLSDLRKNRPIILNIRHLISRAGIARGFKMRVKRYLVAEKSLPPNFDGATYLKLNPDLAAAGVDAGDHFLLHGRNEGRLWALPAVDFSKSPQFVTGQEAVLVVSHEASRTGAPILSFNLVQSLVRKYNVVALLLGGGDLLDAFKATGATVCVAPSVRGNPFVAHHVGSQLCREFDFKFALVNSIESRYLLPVLAEHFVPTISLVHEFASYTRPKSAFGDALFWSSEVVFSANVTKENAFSTFPDLDAVAVHVMPQGKCLLPASAQDAAAEQQEATKLRRLIRPAGLDEDTLVVLGAGFVQLRKGVDLFLECAARVQRLAGARKVRFVWIGSGYDPDHDVAYSVYLHDQIRRAGLENHVAFLGETSAIEAAYDEADVLLLSSRLDPLPNVAIDAMSVGVPVVCFDKTTGIADFLQASGLAETCVAAYLDTADAAEKILRFSSVPGLLEKVGAKCREAALQYFDMERYVQNLEALAHAVGQRTLREKSDYQAVLAAEVLRSDVACYPDALPSSQLARRYVRAWASGIGRRKPFPGFHPGIYQERHGLAVSGADPLADYLQSGQPDGAWSYPVITPLDGPITVAHDGLRLALHVHAYYVDLLPEIIQRLGLNQHRADLFISVKDEAALELAKTYLATYPGRVAAMRVVPNRGRDIGPFLTDFLPAILTSYDLVGHIHTKKSKDVKDENMGKTWFHFLMENLIGGASGPMMDIIVDRLQKDASIGMVFPDDPYITGIEKNGDIAVAIGKNMGISNIPIHFVYPVGTMFWSRTAALKPMDDLQLRWEDYPEEPLPYDGSLLHALERLVALALPSGGWKIAATNIHGVSR